MRGYLALSGCLCLHLCLLPGVLAVNTFRAKRELPSPKEQNGILTARLEDYKKYNKDLKEQEKDMIAKVKSNWETKNEAMKTFEGEKKALQEGVDKLKKEYDEKKHCHQDHADAHADLKDKIVGSLSLSSSNSSVHGEPAAEDDGADKMKYIK